MKKVKKGRSKETQKRKGIKDSSSTNFSKKSKRLEKRRANKSFSPQNSYQGRIYLQLVSQKNQTYWGQTQNLSFHSLVSNIYYPCAIIF